MTIVAQVEDGWLGYWLFGVYVYTWVGFTLTPPRCSSIGADEKSVPYLQGFSRWSQASNSAKLAKLLWKAICCSPVRASNSAQV